MDDARAQATLGAKGGKEGGNGHITLFVDIISPFGYMAYWLTRNSPAFSSFQISYFPILLGGLNQQTGGVPPINIKNKDTWIGKERLRWAKQFSIPISEGMPDPFPQSTVNTQRALCYISSKHPDRMTDALDALYHAFWVEGKTIGKPEVISAALEPKLGESLTKEVMEGIKSDEVKKMLVENTKTAFADGAFGLPWFKATNVAGETEGYWGVDHVGQLLQHMGVETKGEGGYKAML
ncbi:hypothetical protein DOTSEDRAFT_139146 [Dothistroma septosporum NZE10]|uniref:Glutathione S-transferase kappa n=1 Tax=Dothistroma septosporum (strain NZE10 / CBS 128990) TaxID=675120 RepID=M2Y308_DOTSN|nr:hypothetical protein DOTSEDRAFT_139146 [Dothistroma septosporum NZE10]